MAIPNPINQKQLLTLIDYNLNLCGHKIDVKQAFLESLITETLKAGNRTIGCPYRKV